MNYLFDKTEMEPLIKSILYNQEIIINSIIELHIPAGRIQLDPCYNKGNFYASGKVQDPEFKFDVNISWCKNGVKQYDCRYLPFENESINNILFDPPFIIYPGKNMCKKMGRFGAFKTLKKLHEMYTDSFTEFHRILENNGILIVKCQDTTYGKHIHYTHIDDVILPCREIGFIDIDFFILLSRQRIESNKKKQQRNARKYHSYFIVFKKGN
jgi:hypothetical protein